MHIFKHFVLLLCRQPLVAWTIPNEEPELFTPRYDDLMSDEDLIRRVEALESHLDMRRDQKAVGEQRGRCAGCTECRRE